MRQFSYSLLGFCLVLLVSLASCNKDVCEDAVCAPCPSSRFVIEYQDSTGACPAAFHSNARIYAINTTTLDTAYAYNFSDSCQAGFLVQEELMYHIVSGSWKETIFITDFTYQEPLEVTECCLCYPVATVTVNVDGDTTTVDFPAGSYENTPMIRNLN
jgi:hypothetical protein